jgi:signal transduction histidine kinase
MVWPATVQCHWHFASGVTVMADPERLRRALVNVVTNALQAMEAKGAGEQHLEIATRQLSGRCEIVVRDSGEGIPEAIRERIFEPLFSTKNFGVGLGVPIIRNIMEDHGGGVDYRSEVGEGTTVTLWLPLPVDQLTPAA